MPKQASTMTPTRKQDAIEIAYEMMYKKRILRRQMLRLKMLKERKYQNYLIQTPSKRNARSKLTSASSVVAKKSSPIIVRTAKPVTKTNVKPINIAITFNAKSKNDAEREFRTYEINTVKEESPVMQEKVRKQWPKLVCSMEIYPITSHDFILKGAVLPSEINFSFFPPKPPPKAPITAPPPSSSPSSSSPNCTIGNNLQSTTSVGVDNFLAPKKRRIILSDCPPPTFKASLKDPYKANYKLVSFVDLRRKITGGSTPELISEKLKMRDDDCISIFAQTDLITDDDLSVNVDTPVITPIISPTKRVEILNWMAQTSLTSTSFDSDTNTPQFSSSSSGSPDSPDLINNCSSISETTKPHRRFDRFQLSFNSEQSESESTIVATNENEQHSFKMPYSVNTKRSKVSPSSSSRFHSITANSRNSSDVPSSISEYDSSDCDPSVVIPSVSESQRPEEGVVRSLPGLDSPKETLNVPNCNISPTFQSNVKSSPPITKKSDNSLNQPINTSNQPKSIPSIWRKYNNNKAQLLNDASIEASNEKSAPVIKANVSKQKLVEQTMKSPENHLLYSRPPPNFIPNQLKTTNNLPSNAINQNHFPNPPPLFSPNDLMLAENYFMRPPVAIERTPSNGPSIGGQFHLMPPTHQRVLSSNCRQRLPGPRYQRMINVYPQLVRSPNLPPPPTRHFVVQNAQVRQNIGEQQNQNIVQNHPLQFPQIQAVLLNFCSWHYRDGSCRFGQDCWKFHECPQELVQSMTLLQPEEIKKIVSKLYAEKLNSVICELLDSFLQVYVRNNSIIAILDLVEPVLEVNFLSSGKLQCILNALCQLGMKYKNAIIKVLYYVGASNRQLVDILFAIIIDHCDRTTTSTISSNWCAIEQLLESATQLDYGVFSDLCTKSLTEQANSADQVVILTAIGRVLTTEPCKVNVQRMDQVLLTQLSERLAAINGGAGLGGLMRSRLLIRWTGNDAMDQDDRIFEDATISSTIPGPSNANFISSVPLQIPNSTIAAHAKNKSSTTNTERNRNSCSPDSSSYAAANNNNNPSTATITRSALTPSSPFHTPPIPPVSPLNPLPTHFPNQIPDQSQPPCSISPSTTFYNLTDCHSLYTCIIKCQYKNAASLIAKERDSSVEPICKMLHSKAVPVTAAFAFFNVLWDHMEHFLQYKELKRVVLYILFNIYEFLWKEECFTDAASLITTKFSNEKESFLYYKTFLPSGQCSPMQKCHRVIKLLLKEKILEPAFDWFIREEYQSTGIASDMNTLANEKNSLIEEFLQLSYRNLNIAFNLVIFCMNRHLGDFKHHYNCILMQMINSTDHKEKILALRERLYNDQYVYINYQTLRSYVVDFFSHFNLNELLHIYDIISRDKVYPKLTGHEHIVSMRDTLKESEISLILMIFLHQIVQNRIVVTWDVKICFQTEIETGPTMPDGRTDAIVYPRNLLMCSTPAEAVKRLVNVLRSFKYMLPNPADAHKWQACHTSGTVTLYKSHVQAMVMHYRGTQTFT